MSATIDLYWLKAGGGNPPDGVVILPRQGLAVLPCRIGVRLLGEPQESGAEDICIDIPLDQIGRVIRAIRAAAGEARKK